MSLNKTFTHALGAAIALALSDEKGIVVGRAEYSNSEDAYFVRYVDGTGCQRSEWFGESALEAGDSISPTEAAAAAQNTTVQPVTSANHTALGVGSDRDSNGLPWDQRIHSSSKAKNQDGTWRIRKGVDKALVSRVEGELKSTVAAAPAAAPPAAAPPAASVPSIPLPGATVPLPPLPVAAPANPAFTNFVAFLAQHTKSEANPNGRLTDEWVKQMLTVNGVANGDLQNLAHNPALIPPIEAGIKTALGLA